MTTKTIHGNSQFQKPSSLSWTWESPGGGTKVLYGIGPSPPPRKIFFHKESRESRQVWREKSQDYHQLGPLRYVSWFLEDSAVDNIDEEYDPLVEHPRTKKVESSKTTKRRRSLETLELIRQRGAAQAAGNQELTSVLARLCREATKEELKERKAELLAEAAEAGKSVRYARRDFASRKTRMTAVRNPRGTTIASRKGMEKIIYDFYSDLFDSHVHLPPDHLREDGHITPDVLPSEIRHPAPTE
ncbi:hypothetical protein RB195_014550 [Necator americanus]|uniref:Uncharacterized protein n=1 Tax=Necator americanus TaxID=51031 RepID=A0ABR1E136_NECAM